MLGYTFVIWLAHDTSISTDVGLWRLLCLTLLIQSPQRYAFFLGELYQRQPKVL